MKVKKLIELLSHVPGDFDVRASIFDINLNLNHFEVEDENALEIGWSDKVCQLSLRTEK